MTFNGESTTHDVLEGIRLDGQHAVVTGATGGLGIETARALASAGASVTITGRSADKIETALQTLRSEVPEAQFDAEELELASQASAAAAAKRIVDRGQTIHLVGHWFHVFSLLLQSGHRTARLLNGFLRLRLLAIDTFRGSLAVG